MTDDRSAETETDAPEVLAEEDLEQAQGGLILPAVFTVREGPREYKPKKKS